MHLVAYDFSVFEYHALTHTHKDALPLDLFRIHTRIRIRAYGFLALDIICTEGSFQSSNVPYYFINSLANSCLPSKTVISFLIFKHIFNGFVCKFSARSS